MLPIYSIYISRYRNSSGTISNSEALVYNIPIELESHAERAFLEPRLKLEMGKTGSFEFYVTPLNPYYDAWLQLRTIMRITYNDTTIFRGRVLTIDNEYMTGRRKVHLEGDLAFLMDSVQSGTKEEDRTKISALTYLTNVLDAHNSQMNVTGSKHKKVFIGEVPGNYSGNIASAQKVTTESRKYGEDSWRNTSEVLNALRREFGGYFRTRYNASEDKCYLDWLDNSFNYTTNTQQIKLKENLIDVSNTTEVDNLFTALIPIGSKEGKSITIKGYKTDVHGNNTYILVPQIVGQVSDSILNRGYHNIEDFQNAVDTYGIIYKTQSFSNADTQEKLWNYAVDWIAHNYVGGICSFSIKAIDMHHVNTELQPLFVGDRVKVVYPTIGNHVKGVNQTNTGGSVSESKTLTIISIDYDLYHPENNTYTIGVPSETLGKTYGEAIKKSSGSSSAQAAATASGGASIKQDTDADRERIEAIVWDYIANKTYNNKEWEQLSDEEPASSKSVLKATHMILTEELLDDGAGSSTLKKLRRALLNGTTGTISMYPESKIPIKEMTDEQNTIFNKWAKTLVLDGESSLLSFKAKMDVNGYNDPIVAQKNRDMMRLKADAEKAEAGLTLYPWKKTQDGNENIAETLTLNGGGVADPTGWLGTMKGLFGQTGLSTDALVNIDGPNSVLEMVDSVSKGNFSWNKLKLLLTGEDGGAVEVGKEENDPATWAITLNRPIEYTDPKTGQTIRLSKTIHAEDFHVDEIGSFKTKLGVFDRLIAGAATIGDLETERARIGELETTVTDQGIEINQTIKGSALWAKKDDITGVVGKFKIKTVGGKEVLVVESGGGFRVHENNADMGLYMTDSGGNTVLTGGIMVNKINDGSVTTKIIGDRVDIEASQVRVGDTTNVENWMSETGETLDEYHGMIIQRATVEDLRVQKSRIDELVSKSITTDNLESSIAKINMLRGLAANFSGNISSDAAIIGAYVYAGTAGNAANLADSISGVKISGPDNNVYTLQYKTHSNGTWTDAGTFSRAVSSIIWGWADGKAKATVMPTNQKFESDAIDSLQLDGDPTWASNKKSFTQNIAVYSGDTKIISIPTDTQFYTTESWNAGYDKAKEYVVMPSSGTATTFTVKVPNSARTGSDDKTFTMKKGTPATSGYASVSYGGVAVAQIDISDWYSGGWNAGYDKAKGYVIMPSAGTKTTFVVKVPNSARTGSEDKTFTMKKGTPSTSGYASVSYNSSAVAQIDISNWYITGFSKGWDAACNAITRSNNVIYGPKKGTATEGTTGSTEVKYTANYTKSEYTMEKDSYGPSSNTYSQASLKIAGSTITSDRTENLTNFTGTIVFKQSSNTYKASTHSHTNSQYKASSFSWS